MHKLGRSRPDTISKLFDVATSYASGKETVGAVFKDQKGKRAEVSPAESSKPANPSKKQKRNKKGKKPRQPCNKAQKDSDSDEALAAEPNHKGPRGPLVVAASSTTCSRSPVHTTGR